jgi:hypothetical protein
MLILLSLLLPRLSLPAGFGHLLTVLVLTVLGHRRFYAKAVTGATIVWPAAISAKEERGNRVAPSWFGKMR